MADYIHLVGAEEVSRAGNNMRAAADTMSQAASSISESNDQFLRRFEDLVTRMEHALRKSDDG